MRVVFIFLQCMVQDQPNLCKSIQHICILPSCLLLSSYPRVSYHHGSPSPGAVYQLHDRLNHCAADVAAGENVPRLNHGARREEMTEVPEESERYEENQHCYCPELQLSLESYNHVLVTDGADY
ncbi:hypothetical protein JOQ06_017055 [Pogonophryne albipinna]|uniref:Uncharacterized protein n=1 Tax=Pogonophryne albipinna TaxID=1090488 RepID=A0AAD6FJ48_9TELE|nr:hypothetical protein JOQ06_017055 [Pogonophryne albipinna]